MPLRALLPLLAALALATSTAGAQVPLGAVLSGDQEVPPVTTNASGTAHLTLNMPAQTITYRVRTTGLVATAAHLHTGAAGTNGPVLFPLTGGPTAWEGTSPALTDTQVADLLQEGTYVNVHTAAHPGGELRGQVSTVVRRPLEATLDGAQQNPPVTTSATGRATVHLEKPFNTLSYDVTTNGLTATAAHIHTGPAGVNGPVLHGLSGGPTRWNGTTPAISDAEAQALLAGRNYVNVHTAAHPGGEIRGQLFVPGRVAFVAHLDGSQAVPRTTSNGSGFARFILDEAAGTLSYEVDVGGLSGTVTAAHLHAGVMRAAGPVAIDLAPGMGATSWSGSANITAAQIETLYAQGLYINVHTTAVAAGEIRGQVVPNPMSYGFGTRLTSEYTIDHRESLVEIGGTTTVTLRGAAATVPCELFLGTDAAAFGPTPLPIAAAGSFIWIDAGLLTSVPLTSDGVGYAAVPFAIPNDPGLVGIEIYLQWLCMDPRGPALSSALQSTIH